MKSTLRVLAVLYGLLSVCDPVFAQNWSITTMPEGAWAGVACSADGMNLVVDGYSSGIWVSTNRGATWTTTDTSTTRWSGVASSADGTKLAAVSQDAAGAIYVSTNAANGPVVFFRLKQ